MSGFVVIPAIDLYGGRVIRLRKGDFASRTEYGESPIEAARRFHGLGCGWLHIVDLEGAEAGEPRHLAELERIASELGGMRIEYGGGLRTADAIGAAIDAGASRVMAGSVMFGSPDAPREIFARFGARVAPSVDVKGGRVAVAGWKESTGVAPADAVRELAAIGYEDFLVTAVERDGMLSGPDMALYRELSGLGANLIAAGGVTTIENARALRDAGAAAAVVGKALYEGGFDLAAAIEEFRVNPTEQRG